VEDVHSAGVDKPAPATVYARAGVVPPVRPGRNAAVRRAVTFAIRSPRAGAHVFVRELTAAVHGVNANLPLAKVRTLDDVYQLSTARTSFTLILLGIAAAVALSIAIVGVNGVLAYAVAQRRHELGIRAALGSRPEALAFLFLRQGLALTCAGAVIGLAAAAVVSRSMASLLFGVSATDPVTYVVAAVAIGSAALGASYIPARRAARVDPMETLRAS
jgi:ABC-type antimicrobial peptide transport system permease subunit